MTNSSKISALIRWVIFVGIAMIILTMVEPLTLYAQQSQQFLPLTRIPGVDYTSATTIVDSFVRIVFIAAALLAVIRIIWGGILYLTTEAVTGKSEGKSMIQDALVGLLLIIVAVLLLTIINPDLLNIRVLQPGSLGNPLPGITRTPVIPSVFSQQLDVSALPGGLFSNPDGARIQSFIAECNRAGGRHRWGPYASANGIWVSAGIRFTCTPTPR
jgi:hypothetical protein